MPILGTTKYGKNLRVGWPRQSASEDTMPKQTNNKHSKSNTGACGKKNKAKQTKKLIWYINVYNPDPPPQITCLVLGFCLVEKLHKQLKQYTLCLNKSANFGEL